MAIGDKKKALMEGSTTHDMVGAAPAGYGLGEIRNTADDLNDVNLRNGFYTLSSHTINYPSSIPNSNYGVAIVQRRNDDVYQTVIYGSCIARRNGNTANGEWDEWEYENPPMTTGVEYRTTERYNGKPVYVKLVDMGTLTANANKEVYLGDGTIQPFEATAVTKNLCQVINGYRASSAAYHYVYTLSADNRAVVGIRNEYAGADITATAKVKYTKSTD